MENELLITKIKEIDKFILLNEQAGRGELRFRLEIDVTGSGDFSEYIDKNKEFNIDDFLYDVLIGRIKIIGIES